MHENADLQNLCAHAVFRKGQAFKNQQTIEKKTHKKSMQIWSGRNCVPKLLKKLISGNLGLHLGRVWRVLGPLLGALGDSVGALGAILGRSWGLLGRLWDVQNRSKNRSENRSEIEPDPDRPKTLWSYACNGFRAWSTLAEPGWGRSKKLSKPLSIWLVLIYIYIYILKNWPPCLVALIIT